MTLATHPVLRPVMAGLLLGSSAALFSTAGLAQQATQPVGSTLNLKDADIGTLITTVGEITGQNFIVDPRVKGQVTVISTTPMSPEDIYGVFLSVLQVHGFAAVPAGPVTKIVPEVGAKQDGGSHFDFYGMADDEIVTRVIEIVNVPAAQLVPILRPLVPQYGHLAAYSPSNMLIISDRAANVGRMTEIIRRIDQGGDDEVEVIRLRNASAADVQQTLNGLLQSQQSKRDPSQQPITLIADERTNSLILSSDKAQRMRIRALIAHLDIPLEEDGDTQVIYLSYADAETLAPILEGYAETQTNAKGGAKKEGSGGSNPDVRIVAEPNTNALVITAPPKIMRGLRSVIAQLDIRRAQVLVEAILAEVSINRSRQLGIDWAVLNDERIAAASIFNQNVITGAAAAASGNIAGATGLLRTGFNVGGGSIKDDGTSFALLLNALAGDGETNVLSTPSLVTMDNEEAEISVGQEVPFLTGSYGNSNTGSTVNPFQTIERRDVGLTLGITPQINEGDTIKLTIKQESSNVSAGTAGAVDLITNKRTLNTTVMVGNGDILVLGGLIDDNVQRTEQKVPILGDIPLLGALFRSSSVENAKQNLMIFIRSTILRDRESASYYTRVKYDRMRHLQDLANEQPMRVLGRTRGPVLEQLDEQFVPPPQPAPVASPAPAKAADGSAAELPPGAAESDTNEPQNSAPVATPQPSMEPLISTEPVLTPRKKMGRGHLR